jgi:hypothetical protein
MGHAVGATSFLARNKMRICSESLENGKENPDQDDNLRSLHFVMPSRLEFNEGMSWLNHVTL